MTISMICPPSSGTLGVLIGSDMSLTLEQKKQALERMTAELAQLDSQWVGWEAWVEELMDLEEELGNMEAEELVEGNGKLK